jgi:hypothetical protein
VPLYFNVDRSLTHRAGERGFPFLAGEDAAGMHAKSARAKKPARTGNQQPRRRAAELLFSKGIGLGFNTFMPALEC